MKFFEVVFGKASEIVFGKAFKPDTECEYKSICAAYQNDSQTCTHEVDKSYCGKYRRFL